MGKQLHTIMVVFLTLTLVMSNVPFQAITAQAEEDPSVSVTQTPNVPKTTSEGDTTTEGTTATENKGDTDDLSEDSSAKAAEDEKSDRSQQDSGASDSTAAPRRNSRGGSNLKVELHPLAQTQYEPKDSVTTGIYINGADLTAPLDGAYLDVIMPTTLYEGGTALTTDSYIDNFAIATENIPIIKNAVKRVEGGKTIYRVYFNTIDSTTRIEIPYVFSFADKLTPANYKLQPSIKVYDGSDQLIHEENDKEYTPVYKDSTAYKMVASDIANDQLLYGGTSKAGDSTRISENGAQSIPFTFTYTNNSRMMKTVTVTDTLPTYVDSHGNTVTAKFNAAENPGWVDNGDGTVTYTKEFKESDYNGDIDRNIDMTDVVLYLSFPDAQFIKDGTKPTFTNRVDMTGVPYNASPGEKYVASAYIRFNLTADDFSGTGFFGKKNSGSNFVTYDKNGLYAERPTYTIKIANQFSEPLKQITITEDEANIDPRLFITYIDSLYLRGAAWGGTTVLNDKVEIRAYKADGTYDTFNVKDQINADQQNQLNETAEKIRNGEITLDQAPAVTPTYTKIVIDFKDFELPVGYTVDFEVKTAFKDPFKVAYSSERDIKNVAVFDGTVKNSQGTTVPVHASADAAKAFEPLTESMSLYKNTEGQTTGMPGDKVTFRMAVDLNRLSKARYLKNPTIVDLLPKGVSVTPETEVSTFYGTEAGWIESWEAIENYNGSGQTAIKITFKSDLVQNFPGGNSNSPYSINFFLKNLKINDEIIPAKAETASVNNDNQMYFYLDGVDFPSDVNSSQKVTDTKDINMNGSVDDTVLKTTSKVLGNNAESIQSSKYVRSIEPIVDGGGLYYGRAFTGQIATDYQSDANEALGRFQYDLQIKNYFNTDLNKVAIYDVLPHVGDTGRISGASESQFSNTLLGPLTLTVNDQDVTSRFDIYYRTDRYPSMDADTEMNSSQWVTTPADYSKVTALKIVSKGSSVLKSYETLHVIVDMQAPSYDPDNELFGKTATNTFKVQYNGIDSYGETSPVTNTLRERIRIPVTKTWVGPKGEAVTVKLLADNNDSGKTVTLSEDNNWSATFEGLPRYKADGSEIAYKVTEAEVTGVDASKYTTTVTGSAASGFTIKNENKETIDIPVTKTWIGPKGEAVTVKLLADNNDSGKTVTLSKDNNWSAAFEGLPRYKADGSEIAYEVTEAEVTGVDASKYTTTVTGSAASGFTIKNENSEVVSIPVKKVWNGPAADSVTVHLYADDVDTNQTLTLNKANNWQGSFDSYAKYNDDGTEIVYTVKEDAIANYSSKVTGDAASGFTITNTSKETIDIQGSKTWDDDENRDGARPDSITVRLHADGVEKDVKTVTADDNWAWSFEGLPKYDSTDGHEISYILTEDAVAGYATTTNNYDVKNSYTPGKTSVTVTKAWNDANNKDGIRPDSIKVQLYANGKPTGDAVVLSAADQWTYTWTGLFMKENGKNIEYSVKEVTVPKGYESKVTGDATSGFIIENTHKPTEKQPPKKKDSPKEKLAQTGDSANMLLLAALAGAGIAALGVAGAIRRKQD